MRDIIAIVRRCCPQDSCREARPAGDRFDQNRSCRNSLCCEQFTQLGPAEHTCCGRSRRRRNHIAAQRRIHPQHHQRNLDDAHGLTHRLRDVRYLRNTIATKKYSDNFGHMKPSLSTPSTSSLSLSSSLKSDL